MHHADDRSEARIQALHDLVSRSADLGVARVLDRAAGELVGALDLAGVGVILLKGPALSRLLYRPDEHRDYMDIDLLVGPSGLGGARDVLAGLGYRNVSERAGVDDFLGILHAEVWRGPQGVSVDLHWRLPGCDLEAEAAWRRLRADRTAIEIAGRRVEVLGRAGLALHLATHAAQVHSPHHTVVPKALGDLARGVERWPLEDWQAASRLAEDLRATAAFAAGLRRLPEGVRLANALGLPSTSKLNWMIENAGAQPRGTFHISAFADASGRRARAQILRRSLLPRRAWIAAQMPWTGRGNLALLAGYIVHLARAPLWAARAWRFERQARKAGR